MSVIRTKYDVGDNLYGIYNNKIEEFTIFSLVYIQNEDDKGEGKVKYDLKRENGNYYDSIEEDRLEENGLFPSKTELIKKITSPKPSAEKIESNEGILHKFVETDGYSENTIGYFKIPGVYIRNLGNSYNSSTHLTEEGLKWFRKNIYENFDNGGYYRLYILNDDDKENLKKKYEKYKRIVEML